MKLIDTYRSLETARAVAEQNDIAQREVEAQQQRRNALFNQSSNSKEAGLVRYALNLLVLRAKAESFPVYGVDGDEVIEIAKLEQIFLEMML